MLTCCLLVLAAGRLRSSEDAHQQTERRLHKLEEDLAEQKATERRLRERLTKREATSNDRKEV